MSIAALAALVTAYALGPMATQILTPPFRSSSRMAISMAAARPDQPGFATIAVMTVVRPLSDRFGRAPADPGGPRSSASAAW